MTADENHTNVLPTSRHGWMTLLDRLGVRPNKGLGQHFLFERGIVHRLVKTLGVTSSDHVLEVGPGLGILTEELLGKAGEVTAIELDRHLAAHLRSTFATQERFRLVEGDALKVDLGELFAEDQKYLVAANLPYAVASAVLRHLLEAERPPARTAVMVQREVADRITAQPPNMSVLSVAVQYYAETRLAFTVPPTVFIPPPRVESAVIVLVARDKVPLALDGQRRFFQIVNAGFRHKRKQIANSIVDETNARKEVITAWLAQAGIDSMRRAQTLTLDEWVALAGAAPDSVWP